jgi:hypothetical protein
MRRTIIPHFVLRVAVSASRACDAVITLVPGPIRGSSVVKRVADRIPSLRGPSMGKFRAATALRTNHQRSVSGESGGMLRPARLSYRRRASARQPNGNPLATKGFIRVNPRSSRSSTSKFHPTSNHPPDPNQRRPPNPPSQTPKLYISILFNKTPPSAPPAALQPCQT